MTKKQLAARLRKVRRELDECAEWIERLADDVETPTVGPELLGLRELAETMGLQYRAAQQRMYRGQLPEPYARLACGPVWIRSDVEQWSSSRRAA